MTFEGYKVSGESSDTPSDSYWCLFCGNDGPRWTSIDELFEHMKNTVHKDDKGNMILYTGEN